MTGNYDKVHVFIRDLMVKIERKPTGKFQYPSLATTSGQFYADGMFSWDTHHMTLRYAIDGRPEFMKYYLLTMLEFQRSNGYVPSICSASDGGTMLNQDFHCQPWLAQNAAIYLNATGDQATVKSIFTKLDAYLKYWLNNFRGPNGLYRWAETWMSGFDNEIIGSLSQLCTIMTPDISSLLYLECLAMAWIAGKLGEDASYYNEKAAALKAAVNDWLWDEEYGVYSSFNTITGRLQTAWGDGTLTSDVGRYAYVSCPSLMALYSGIAPKDRAERMIREYVLSPKHFRSKFGIRSLSASSEYYNNARWGNPPRYSSWKNVTASNWQGPVWIPLNWFVFHGLLRYGFDADALALADDTVDLISQSLDRHGFMRENYHAETGEGLYADYFASWNILSDVFHNYIEPGKNRLNIFPWE